jgi:tartrate-resistant acid phosphatase type 5
MHTYIRVAYLDDPTIQKDANNFFRLANQTAQHLSSLNDTLRASTAKWKIVVGHHPVFTAGSHHTEATLDPAQPLRQGLRSVLEANNVAVYFAGHDHNQQHIMQEGSRLHYVVSGAGSSVRSLREFELGVQFFSSTQGFVWATVTPNLLRVRYVDSLGTVLYAFEEQL